MIDKDTSFCFVGFSGRYVSTVVKIFEEKRKAMSKGVNNNLQLI